MSEKELTPMTVVLEDAVFFFSDIDLQAEPECAVLRWPFFPLVPIPD
jgi:hypothetical protein